MDLHVGTAVPKPRGLVLEAFKQVAVELCRRHVANHRVRGRNRLAFRRPHPAVEHPLDVHTGLARAAAPPDQRHQRVGELLAPATRDRHPALLDGDGDHLRHVARGGRVWAETRVKHPRREQAVCALRPERRLEPVPRRDEQAARELGRALPAEAANRFHPQAGALTRPELGTEDPEGEVGIAEELTEHRAPCLSVAGTMAVQLGRVLVRRAQKEGALAVGIERPGRQIGVDVLEAVPREVVRELRVRRTPNPERMPGAEDIVPEARHGDLVRFDRPAEPVVSLEHADTPAVAREQRGAGETVDPAADDDGVVVLALYRASLRNSSSVTRPRFSVPSFFTAASTSARRSSGRSSPSSSALIRIESRPLFFPRTMPRSAATSSDEYGSIASGSWNWLATAPLSRRKRFSPVSGFHGSSS